MTSQEVLDLRGVPCPTNSARALIRIAMMQEGEHLEIWLDNGEPLENVPPALSLEGHTVVTRRPIESGAWSLLIRVGG